MFNHALLLDGPDFLGAVADAELGQGNTINAAEYLKRQREWAADKKAIEDLQAQVDSLLAARRAARALPMHSITPSDRR